MSYDIDDDLWEYSLKQPNWLRRLSMRCDEHGGFYNEVFNEDLAASIEDERDPSLICLELIMASNYPAFVGEVSTRRDQKELEILALQIEKFGSKNKLPNNSFKEFARYLSLGSVGIFGGHVIHPKWLPHVDQRKYIMKKGICFRNGVLLAEKFKVNDDVFTSLIKDEFERELFKGNVDRFHSLYNCSYAHYSSEGIAEYVLQDEKLIRVAAQDRFITRCFSQLKHSLGVLASGNDIAAAFKDISSEIEYGFKGWMSEEKELSGVLEKDYMLREVKKLKDAISHCKKQILDIHAQYYG